MVSILPTRQEIGENTIITGPFKKDRIEKKEFAQDIQRIGEIFLRQVMLQRKQITLSKEELAEAKLYHGMDAIDMGLIDAIGSRTDAAQKAAELAGVRNYATEMLEEEDNSSLFRWLSVNTTSANTVPLHYYMYIPEK